MLKRLFAYLGCAAALAALSGCEQNAMVTSPPPLHQPDLIGPRLTPRSAESLQLQQQLAVMQAEQLSFGLLRRDGGGPDARFGQRELVENFLRVALFDEYAMSGGRLVARQTASKLRRFLAPIGVNVYFGASVPLSQREKDRADITAYTARLARATGHPVSMRRENPNFLVLVLNEDERKNYHARLRELLPDVGPRDISAILRMPRHTQCHVFAWAPENDGTYTRAVAVVRAEHPDLTRLSCYHEELAQGLGLPNDSPRARPSVFNDDEEFGLLTHHDELLLKILYDPRLRPGMTSAEARPIVEEIATGLIGGA